MKSLPSSAAASACLLRILHPIVAHRTESLPTPSLVFFFSVKSVTPLYGGSYFKVKGQVWLYLSATLNYSGCGKAPVVERRCVKISHCGFFSRKWSVPAALLRLADCLAFLFVVDSLHFRQRLILAWTRNSHQGNTFLKLLKLRWFDSMRVCQSPSVRSFELMYFAFYSLPFLYSVGTRFCINGQLITFWV